jgi:hypothetical protein
VRLPAERRAVWNGNEPARRAWQDGSSMADLNVEPGTAVRHEIADEDDYANWEIALWLLGILAIPGVPILMVVLLTPWTGL